MEVLRESRDGRHEMVIGEPVTRNSGDVETLRGQAQRWPGRARVGRSTEVLKCCCGRTNEVFSWSFAGHGKAKCGGCGCWILRYSLNVVEIKRAKVRRKPREIA
jgi:hypothetical protein